MGTPSYSSIHRLALIKVVHMTAQSVFVVKITLDELLLLVTSLLELVCCGHVRVIIQECLLGIYRSQLLLVDLLLVEVLLSLDLGYILVDLLLGIVVLAIEPKTQC